MGCRSMSIETGTRRTEKRDIRLRDSASLTQVETMGERNSNRSARRGTRSILITAGPLLPLPQNIAERSPRASRGNMQTEPLRHRNRVLGAFVAIDLYADYLRRFSCTSV